MNTNFLNNIRSLLNPNPNTNSNTNQNANTLLSNEEALNYLNNVLFITNNNDYDFQPTLPYRIMYAHRTQLDLSYIENFISTSFTGTSFTGTSFTSNKKKVIANTELNKLQHITFKKEDELHTNIECPIMCYEFSENEEIIKLPCQHNYNKDAILKWLKQESHTCPICRYEFEYTEISNVKDEDEGESEGEGEGEDEDEDLNNSINSPINSPNNYISVDEFMMQEILLNSFSSNNSNTNNSNTN